MAKKRANGEGNIRKRTDGTQGVGQAVDPHLTFPNPFLTFANTLWHGFCWGRHFTVF